jgi:hypothetical protein
LIEIDIGVVQFGEAKTGCWQNTIEAARIERAWRTVALPGAARQFVKLLPIAFVPSGHLNLSTCSSLFWMPRRDGRFTPIAACNHRVFPLARVLNHGSPTSGSAICHRVAEKILQNPACKGFSSADVSNTLRGDLLRDTRRRLDVENPTCNLPLSLVGAQHAAPQLAQM